MKNKNDVGASLLSEGLDTCSWCGTYVFGGQPSLTRDGDVMHLSCAAEEDEDATFDRDMGFGG